LCALDDWLDVLSRTGVDRAIVRLPSRATWISPLLEGSSRVGNTAIQPENDSSIVDSARAFSANLALADDSDHVIIIQANSLSDVDLGSMLAFHLSHGDPLSIMLVPASQERAPGTVSSDESRYLAENPDHSGRTSGGLASAGVYIATKSAFREVVRAGGADLEGDVIPRFLGRFRVWVWNGYHRDISTQEARLAANGEAPTLRAERRRLQGGGRPAVFLDRDGTLIEAVHYISEPSQVRVLPGVAVALRRLENAGFARVVVTNQSGIGRGLLTVENYEAVNRAMLTQLAEEGASVDRIEFCQHVPESTEKSTVHHNRRKPGPGMLLDAAEALGIDTGRSWIVGDMLSDLLAGQNAGCRGSVLVATGKGLEPGEETIAPCHLSVADLTEAASRILEGPWHPIDEKRDK
jgi:D-glycero-D-manno-heptose 1,7-bisphosphate phosphatase